MKEMPMKPTFHFSDSRPSGDRTFQAGMTLVVVLFMLVIFVGLTMAIFYTAARERQLSSHFANSGDARRLVDSAVNLVITQISDATSATNRAWISQPGLIRTFTGNRQPAMNYRLYSSGTMRVSGAYNPAASGNAVPADWGQNTALYCDLNQPVPDRADPTNASLDQYPIFPPPTSGTNAVQGYAVSGAPLSGGAGANPVPMPVQWIYVLQDGTQHAGTANGTGNQVTVAAASASNPIVGRIAFWADDESAKINVNTSAGGEFWTTPWFHTHNEQAPGNAGAGGVMGFGFSKPVRNEFQRYPGHPFTTDLRTVFPELTKDEIYTIIPRVVSGGSRNGANATDILTSVVANDPLRLFPTVGEMIYSTTLNGTNRQPYAPAGVSNWKDLVKGREAFLTAHSRSPELTAFGTPRVAIWPIYGNTSDLNYLTTTDRLIASCATLFSGTTPYPFYFSRGKVGATPTWDSQHPTAAVNRSRNREIYAYLQRLLGLNFPGLSGNSFSGKYGVPESNQILTEIFDYIRSTNITDVALGNPSNYYNQESTVVPTINNNTSPATYGFGRSLTVRQIGLAFICNASGEAVAPYTVQFTASGNITKTITGLTRNKSNYPPGPSVTFSNVIVDGLPVASLTVPYADFINTGIPAYKPEANLALDTNTPLAANERRLQALLLLEFTSPSAGGRGTGEAGSVVWNFRLRDLVTSGTGMNATLSTSGSSVVLTMPSDIAKIGKNLVSGGFTHPGMFGGPRPYKWIYAADSGGALSDMRTVGNLTTVSGASAFPYVTPPVTVTVNSTSPLMDFGGAKLAVEVWHPRVSTLPASPISNTIKLDLPAVSNLPVPQLVFDPTKPLIESAKNWVFHRNGPFGGGGGNATRSGRFNSDISQGNISPIVSADTVLTYMVPHGDTRLLFNSGTNTLSPIPPASAAPNMRHRLIENFDGNLQTVSRASVVPGFENTGRLVQAASYAPEEAPVMPSPGDYPAGMNAPWTFGDWDTGTPMQVADGALINKPDEGILGEAGTLSQNPYSRVGVYYQHGSSVELGNTETAVGFITPNRQIPSAVMFGSLPTGVVSGKPWQTLLFRPDPGGHPGAADPPDHLLLDLFWMPIAEPYPISEPFSTAGKVNMNYQIVPFTYIERSTGVRAVLEGEKIAHGPPNPSGDYGKVSGFLGGVSGELREDLDVDATLAAFSTKFGSGGVFLTASEVITLDLIPKNYASSAALWNAFPLTGENIKERPYATIYPRLTTKSNVFNTFYRVQVLRKRPGSDPTVWNDGTDIIVAEKRGNTLLERYLDLNRGFSDYATTASAPSAETLYRFRVLLTRDFIP